MWRVLNSSVILKIELSACLRHFCGPVSPELDGAAAPSHASGLAFSIRVMKLKRSMAQNGARQDQDFILQSLMSRAK